MEKYIQLKKFRSLMNLSVSKEDIIRIWGKRYLEKIETKMSKKLPNRNRNKFVDKKLDTVKQNISSLQALNLVKFIAVTGSVGAGFAKEEDDIDVYVVVRNNSMWLYRGVVSIKNLFHNKIRAKRHRVSKDKICLNFVSEERGLHLEDDIFNFHELMYMKPIYNNDYLHSIYFENKWLIHKYGVRKELLKTDIEPQKSLNLILLILDKLFYFSQLLFMVLSHHRPEIRRLETNSKIGKIEFFPKDFKAKKIEEYSDTFKLI